MSDEQGDRSIQRGIVIGMVVGALIGLPLNILAGKGIIDEGLARTAASWGKSLGDLFLRLLQMLVVPLILSSLVSSVGRIGSMGELGKLGGRTMGYYLLTSALAIVTGLLVVNLINPGVGTTLDLEGAKAASAHIAQQAAEGERSVGAILWAQLLRMIPKNPVSAAAGGDMLAIIFFAIMLGVFIKASASEQGEEGELALGVGRFFDGFFNVMMRMTMWVVRLSPYGVFGFMLYAAAGKGLEAFGALAWYMVAVALGLGLHAFVTLPVLLKVLAGRSPLEYAKAMSPALLTAFGTASSNATLPLTISSAEQRGGISNRTTSFVLPLGATVNMDGTALYEVVAVLFIAQVYGNDLSLAQQAIVAITALLASVGAAGIPHAGTIMMVIVLEAVGLPTEGVGLILAVDRVLDMCRTSVNVWSDSTACAVVERSL